MGRKKQLVVLLLAAAYVCGMAWWKSHRLYWTDAWTPLALIFITVLPGILFGAIFFWYFSPGRRL